ncbi:MAG: aminotransferase class V-fold PLP-dependent enzyme [Deltaproteobacteria bacterium]|nr:aminotransferase class V-fold PLP-dependent enzyme [Deltaproteobacteria bacterium]MBW2417072.1 aminotransferase class V-fold PLP-dependent enzyme [Deltaproteobacteria bacterium]
MADSLRSHWILDSEVAFLNHGSFGACPKAVLDAQTRYRERLEREPMTFFLRDGAGLLSAARQALGDFVGADAEELAFVPNVTAGINALLHSMHFDPGDELLVSDHAYNASRNILDEVARRDGCKVVVVRIPFPIDSPERVVQLVQESVTPKTRAALLDHVTSPTGLVLPLEAMIEALHERGIEVVVDGAHAPGMLDLDLRSLGADYYAANCHKWLCSPKTAGFIYVPLPRQGEVRPRIISHGANAGLEGPARFRAEFDWTGTRDITPWLATGDAIAFLGGLLPGGWPALRERNRNLVLWAREHVARKLGVALPCPDSMVGSMAALILPASERFPARGRDSHFALHPLNTALFEQYRVEIPVHGCPGSGETLVRLSAALYNERGDYERLAEALAALL